MITQLDLSVRPIKQEDRQKLANLIHFETYVHRHLDWRPPLDWLGYEPYLVAEHNGNLVASLACPPEPDSVSWIRLFAASADVSVERAWRDLWQVALDQLRKFTTATEVGVIPLQTWFLNLLKAEQFEEVNRVVMLQWEGRNTPSEVRHTSITIRPMSLDDLQRVEAVDAAAFRPMWQNSKMCLEVAFRQAASATVAEDQGRIVGYQISTATPMGAHLARLAVLPELQGSGIGYTLVRDLLSQFLRRGIRSVTVNTQQDNNPSLTLYKKLGFRLTGEEYAIYWHSVRG